MTTVISGSNPSITFSDSTTQNTSPFSTSTFGFKNRIINGGMVIDQRNAGASVIPASGTYTLDRWEYFGSQASKVTVQQLSASPPNGYANYLGMTVSTAVTSIGATDYFEMAQKIEANNVADFAWGTSSGQPISISFWAKCSNTGSFSASVQSSISPYTAYPFLFTITSTGTWQYITVNIPAPPSGTNWASGNSTGLSLYINLAVGSTYSGTANAWTNTNSFGTTGASSLMGTVGNYLYITGVQLEVGTQATSFDFRDYGSELIMCQRYYTQFGVTSAYEHYGIGVAQSSTSVTIMNLPVTMRTAPTFAFLGSYSNYVVYDGSTSYTPSAIAADVMSLNVCSLAITVTGIPAGRATRFYRSASSLATLTYSAEL